VCKAEGLMLLTNNLSIKREYIMDQETKICFNCSWINPIQAKYCEFCNANLPQIFQEKPPEKIDILDKAIYKKVVDYGWFSPKFQLLMETCENMLEGTISVKQYKEVIEELHYNITMEIEMPEGLKNNIKNFYRTEKTDKAEEIMDTCIDALYAYDEAFEKLKLYIKDKEPEHIQEGLELALDSKNKICEVLSELDKDENEYKEILKKLE